MGRSRKGVDPAYGFAAQNVLAERHLHQFVRYAWHVVEPKTVFRDNWHIGCICEHLQAVLAGQIRNLVINMPPRHSKSLIVCVFWPVWSWIKDPGVKFLYSAYAESLSARDAGKARELIGSDWFQHRWADRFQIKSNEDTRVRYVNSAGGHRISTSVGGRGTGEGGDVICTDDPQKINESESDTMREAVIDWWDQVMGTRGNDPKTVRRVIVMQRLKEDDLSGHALSQELGYDHLCLPCRYDPGRVVYSFAEGVTAARYRKDNPDVIYPTSLQRARPELRDPRTQAGELLWKEHFGDAEVKALETTLGPWGASSQLDQKPVPKGGGIIKTEDFQYFVEEFDLADGKPVRYYRLQTKTGQVRRVPADLCRHFQTCDTALKTGQENDYTAVGTFAQTPDNELLVIDMFNDKIEIPYILGVLLGQRMKYPHLLYQAVEDKQSGTAVIQQARLQGTPFRELQADTDPMRRAAAIATMYSNRMVYHNADMRLLAQYEQQVHKFPKAKFDDMFTCCPAGTLVRSDRGMIPIESVRVGDQVLTHRFRMRSVTSTSVRKAATLCRIVSTGRPDVLVTPDHLVRSPKSVRKAGRPGGLDWASAEWVSVDRGLVAGEFGTVTVWQTDGAVPECIDLMPHAGGYYEESGVLVPYIKTKNGFRRNPKGKSVQRYIPVTPEFCRVVGYYAAEGSCGRHQVTFASGRSEDGPRASVSTWAKSVGLEAICYKNRNSLIQAVGCLPLRNWFSGMSKGITKAAPDWVNGLTSEMAKAFLTGYLIGDGHFDAAGISAPSVSPTLAFQVYETSLRLGLPATIKKQKSRNGYSPQWVTNWARPAAEVVRSWISPESSVGKSIPDTDRKCSWDETHVKITTDGLVGRISKIDRVFGSVDVFCLKVDEDESYVADGVVVHNCASYAGLLSTTDALIRSVSTVENLFVYPNRDDLRSGAERAGVSEDRYEMLYENWDDEGPAADFVPPPRSRYPFRGGI